MLEVACDKARSVRLDQVFFGLDDAKFHSVVQMLDAPATTNAGLERLMAVKPVWPAAHAQGMKLGASLLKDAVKRCALVSPHAGIRALLVHALHDRAKQFYAYYGFQASPVHPLTLLLRLQHS
jgi:hypothetical protein